MAEETVRDIARTIGQSGPSAVIWSVGVCAFAALIFASMWMADRQHDRDFDYRQAETRKRDELENVVADLRVELAKAEIRIATSEARIEDLNVRIAQIVAFLAEHTTTLAPPTAPVKESPPDD